MVYKHLFDPIAAQEYLDAYNWYAEKSGIAADGFLIAVEDMIRFICQNPGRFRNNYKKLREVSLKKYPFTIIYAVDESSKLVIITSIFHHRRSPKKKYKK